MSLDSLPPPHPCAVLFRAQSRIDSSAVELAFVADCLESLPYAVELQDAVSLVRLHVEKLHREAAALQRVRHQVSQLIP